MQLKSLSWIAAVVLATSAISARAEFADPLDTHASPSTLASRGLFNGLAIAGSRLVAVGQRGHILYSDDHGKAWQQATVPVSSDLTAVTFPTVKKGWAVGHDGVVLVSSDAGASWTKQLDGRALGPLMVRYYADHAPDKLSTEALAQLRADVQRYADEGPDKPFLDVWFENEMSGFVVGAFNLVLHTDDGGRTWEPWLHRTENPHLFHFYAVRPVGDDLYLAGEQGLLQKLDRKTQRFHTVAVPYKGTLFGVTGKPGALLVFGLRGNVFRSKDAGVSWQHIETQLQQGLTAGALAADGRIVLVSQAGQVLVSVDDGNSFARIKIEQQVPAGAVMPLDGNSLLIGGARGLHVRPY